VRGWLPPRDFLFTTGENQMSFEVSRNKNSREGTQAPSSLQEPLFDDEAWALYRIGSALAPEGDGRALRLCADRVVPRLRKRAAASGVARFDELADELSRWSLRLAAANGAEDLTVSEADLLWRSRGELVPVLMKEMRCANERSRGDRSKAVLH
jgi:hypothetical protein